MKIHKETKKDAVLNYLDNIKALLVYEQLVYPIQQYLKKGEAFYLYKFQNENYLEIFTIKNKRLLNYIVKYLKVNVVYWLGTCSKNPDGIGIEFNESGEKWLKKVRYLNGKNREITEIAKIN